MNSRHFGPNDWGKASADAKSAKGLQNVFERPWKYCETENPLTSSGGSFATGSGFSARVQPVSTVGDSLRNRVEIPNQRSIVRGPSVTGPM